MDEVLNHSFRHLFAHEFRHQIQMIVVADDYGSLFQGLGFGDNSICKSLVHRDIAAFPGIMDRGIYIGVIRRVPHIVLQEPEERIAKDVVVLVVNPAGSHHVAQIDLVAR